MRPTPTTLWLVVSLLLARPAAPAPAGAGEEVLVDRLVAVVDDDPILWSDVDRVIGLGLVEPREGENRHELERRVLAGLIDQRLRLHEIARHNFAPLPPDAVDAQLERIRARFESPDELTARLSALGLDQTGLRLLVARQLRVLLYVEQRLGPRVFVRPDEIRAYYDDVLATEMAASGVAPPPLEEVREQIHDLLHEKQLNREIDAWTEELRLAAAVDDYLDRRDAELPPVVERIEE